MHMLYPLPPFYVCKGFHLEFAQRGRSISAWHTDAVRGKRLREANTLAGFRKDAASDVPDAIRRARGAVSPAFPKTLQ